MIKPSICYIIQPDWTVGWREALNTMRAKQQHSTMAREDDCPARHEENHPAGQPSSAKPTPQSEPKHNQPLNDILFDGETARLARHLMLNQVSRVIFVQNRKCK